MSVCDCPWESDTIGGCQMGPRIARSIPKSGNTCQACGCPVEIGSRCTDYAGLNTDGGFFLRFHSECYALMTQFAQRMCGGSWVAPFDLEGAAQHAMANGDEPYWRDWLLLYEQTWSWTPERVLEASRE